MTAEQAKQKLIDYPVTKTIVGYYRDKDGEIKFGSVVICNDEQLEKAISTFIAVRVFELKQINF